jgi:hypothetical protein
VLNFVRLGGAFTIVGLIAMVWYLLEREPRKWAVAPDGAANRAPPATVRHDAMQPGVPR